MSVLTNEAYSVVPQVFKPTTAIAKMKHLTGRFKGIPGGTSAGKTYGILPILITRAAMIPHLEISVVSMSMPHLRKGAVKDFKKIMQGLNRWNKNSWHGGDHKYTFWNGSYIEFFSADNAGKVHGPRRHKLYINEANRIPFETYHALMIRTSEDIWIDFNPVNKFWYHKEVIGDPDWVECRLTYKDNEALSPVIVKELEKARDKGFVDPDGDVYDPDNIVSDYWANWWRVYGLGLLGTLEGQIFKNWKFVHKLPKVQYVYGLDFGYTHDQTALVRACKYKGQLYAQELWYRTNYSSSEMIEYLYSIGVTATDPIICDHDFTAVQDLRDHGFKALKADKSKGSVESGVQALQDIDVNISNDSINFMSEIDNYFWDTKDGQMLNKPIDAFNHLIDALRYAYDYIKNPVKYLKQNKEARRGKGKRRVVYAGK